MSTSLEPIRVGVLFSQSGQCAQAELALLRGFILGVSVVNDEGGVDGRLIEPVICDPASDIALTRKLCTDLIVEANVAAIFGCCTSLSRKAVLPIVERHNSLLWYPTLFEGFEYSSNVIYGGPCPNQHIVPLAKYLIAQGRRNMFLIGSDYIFPRESNRIMREVFENLGGRIVGEDYVSFDGTPPELQPILTQVRSQNPDVIFSTVVGRAELDFFRAYRAAKLDPDRVPIAALALSEMQTFGSDPALFVGHITSSPYFESLASEANATFLANLRERYGPTAHANGLIETTYIQPQFFARAIRGCGSVETDAVVEAIPRITVAAPQGTLQIDPENHYTYCWPRIGVAEPNGGFRIVSEADHPIRPDPYLVAEQ